MRLSNFVGDPYVVHRTSKVSFLRLSGEDITYKVHSNMQLLNSIIKTIVLCLLRFCCCLRILKGLCHDDFVFNLNPYLMV